MTHISNQSSINDETGNNNRGKMAGLLRTGQEDRGRLFNWTVSAVTALTNAVNTAVDGILRATLGPPPLFARANKSDDELDDEATALAQASAKASAWAESGALAQAQAKASAWAKSAAAAQAQASANRWNNMFGWSSDDESDDESDNE